MHLLSSALFSPGTFVELAFAWRLLGAAALGTALGLERSLAGKHAGMRTYALVSLGSCLFVVVGTLASLELSFFSALNPLQIASSIVIGIGFIGSGLAVARGQHTAELTTAAGVWVAAGVGMACGFGLYIVAASAAVLSVIIFSLLSPLERTLRKRFGTEVE